ETLTRWRAVSLDRKSYGEADESGGDQCDYCPSEGLRHDPSGPFPRRLVLAGLARRKSGAPGCQRKRDIEHAAGSARTTPRQTIEAAPIFFAVDDRLAQSPTGKTQQSEREQPQQDAGDRAAK